MSRTTSMSGVWWVLVVAGLLAACDSWPWRRPLAPPPETLAPTASAPATATTAPVRLVDETPDADEVPTVVERGTGSFLSRSAVRSQATLTRAATGEVTLNVVDADLREVVRLVLEDALGANYIIDPTVGGTVTVQTTEPIPAENLVGMLDAVLRVNGAALVQSGSLFKVVPIDQALASGVTPEILPVQGAAESGFAIRVVPVRFIGATELAAMMEPFAPPGGSIQVDEQRNTLILGGPSDQLATLTDLVAMFDVDWLSGMSFGLFPLDTAQATDLALELEQIFGDPEAGPLAGVVRVVPIERLNAVLVISSQPAYLDRAQVWVERLDRAAEGEEERVYVYPVQNGRAADLAAVLGELFNVESAAVAPSGLLAPGLEAAEVRSTDFEIGDERAGDITESETRRRSTRTSRTGGIGRIGGIGRTGGTGTAQLTTGAEEATIRIIADETTNSLVIRASPRDYRRIAEALEELDISPLQVLIEATIAEVLLNDQLKYGVEWFFRFGDVEVVQSSRSSGAVRASFPGFAAVFNNADVRVVLNALEQVTDINVISSPHVLVLDNQTARLQVGDQVPIATQSAVGVTDPDAPVVNTIEQRDTGVILSVTPRVNSSGLVIMEIEEETSDPEKTNTSEIDSPTIRQRRIASTVAVQSGETVVLGGLIRDQIERGRSGLPFLSGLPVIGPLFGTRDNVAERNELLVLITPRVVRNPDQARAVTNELRRRMRGLIPLDAKVR